MSEADFKAYLAPKFEQLERATGRRDGDEVAQVLRSIARDGHPAVAGSIATSLLTSMATRLYRADDDTDGTSGS